MLNQSIPLCVAAILVLFSALYYRRCTTNKRAALFLWSLRCVTILLLVCAFFEPILRFRTIGEPGTIIVLVDVSKSMRLFKSDSLARRIIEAFGVAASDKTPPLRVFCFGDSLRRADTAGFSFSDRQSFFPALSGREEFDRSRSIVIVSDGNWSNPILPGAALEGKNCFYLKLGGFSPRPFLHVECPAFPAYVPQDSPYVFKLGIQGFKKSALPLEIIVREGDRSVVKTRIHADTGYFSDTLSIRLPSSRPGRHCFFVRVGNTVDSLDRQIYLMDAVVPGAFKAAVYSAAPTIDKRFLSLALSSADAWRLDPSDNPRELDALFAFDWDSRAREAFSRIKPSGIAVFIGCMPCSTYSFVAPDSFALVSARQDDSLAQNLERMHLPPPSHIVVCSHPALTSIRLILQCAVRVGMAGRRAIDTLPFLFSGNMAGRGALVVAAGDIWKMEFLPLSVERETENTSFLQQVLVMARQRLYANVNKSFFAYPAATELSELDSCAFSFALPPEASQPNESSRRSSINFSVTNNGVPFLDTTFAANAWETSGASGGAETVSGIQTLRLRPFAPGSYLYKATLVSGSVRLVSADTLRVENSDLEYAIQGRNASMLDQVAIPMELSDAKAVMDAASADSQSKKRATRTISFTIEQSWPLFIAIVFLLGLEWIFRRKIGLDL